MPDNNSLIGSRSTIVHKEAFTLIELLVVISVIGILAAFAIASLSGAQSRGRDAQRKNDLNQIQKALQMYYNDYGTYPPGGGWATFIQGGCNGTVYSLLTPKYIKTMPDDPQAPDYHYYYAWGNNTYTLGSHLENANDPQYITQPLGHCGWDDFVSHYVVTEP